MAGCTVPTRTGAACRAPLFRDHDRCYQHHAYRLIFGRDRALQRRTRRCVVTTLAGTRCWIWTRASNGTGAPVCHNHRDASRFAPAATLRRLLRGA